MPYVSCSLPEYPCKRDIWDVLCEEKRPIVIYGMGNGADKLIARLRELGVVFSDIFASDGFIRGHSFQGMRVKSFSEIKERYPEFLILLSFASNRQDVVDMLAETDRNYPMLVPDMPVAGVDEYFDKNFYNENYDKILKTYEMLADEDSKNCLASVVNYKLFGKMEYLLGAYSEREETLKLIEGAGKIHRMVDCGAYNGDTVREAMASFSELESILAIEPDPKNYKKLVKFSEQVTEYEIKSVNAALWSEPGVGIFSSSGNRNSTVSATSSYQHKDESVELSSLDVLCDFKADYVKYDVEGAEYEALRGSNRIISENKPTLLVSLYHRSRDIFEIPLYLQKSYAGYKFYLRRKPCLPAWELELIALPEPCY